MRSLSRSPTTKEKEIDHWRIGGKLTGITSAVSPSRIDRLTNGCRSFADDSGSSIYVPSDLDSAMSIGGLSRGVAGLLSNLAVIDALLGQKQRAVDEAKRSAYMNGRDDLCIVDGRQTEHSFE